MYLPWRSSQPNSIGQISGNSVRNDLAAEVETHKRVMRAGARLVDLSRRAGQEAPSRSPWFVLFDGMMAAHDQYVYAGIVQEDKAVIEPHGEINRYHFLIYTVKHAMIPDLVENPSARPDRKEEPESIFTYDSLKNGIPLFQTPALITDHPRWFEVRQRRTRQDQIESIHRRHQALRYAVTIFDAAAENAQQGRHTGFAARGRRPAPRRTRTIH
jgi:hypothetical protein